MRRCFRGGHPAGRLGLGSVPGDGFLQESVLIQRGASAAGDDDGDPVRCGVHRGRADWIEQHRIGIGHCRMVVIEATVGCAKSYGPKRHTAR